MQIDNNQKGFISLLAMVVFVGVVGGGIVLSSAVIQSVADKECGGHISAWQSGEVYGDITDNKEGAIEKAQKCQEAVNKAVKVAKANAALLGRASNIGSNGAEVVATEFVNLTMDYVESASASDYIPLEKNNRLPEDIEGSKQDEVIEKVDNLIKKEEEQEDATRIDNNINKEEDEEDIGSERDREEDTCFIGTPTSSAPKVLAVCSNENMGFWYADKEGDIASISVRFHFSYTEFGGQQSFEWETAKFESSGDRYCDFQPAIKLNHPDVPAGFRAIITVDIMLEDGEGNKSNTSSCTI